MEINVAVVYTEYQLLQVEAIVSHYNLKNVLLILHNNNNRVSDWLIDCTLFTDVFDLPIEDLSRLSRLSRNYVSYYSSIFSRLFKDKKVNILIGAQDENTVFALAKYYANPLKYWNIEDGDANYLRENLRYRLEIFLKKVLFTFYGFGNLDIRYGHGLVKSDLTFRIYPKLSVGGDKHIDLGEILRTYLKKKVELIKPMINWIRQYRHYDTLVVSDIVSGSDNRSMGSFNTLYKFHPGIKVAPEGIAYIKEKIPIEFLPLLLDNLKTIRYELCSSSILNLLVLNLGIKIQIAYPRNGKSHRFYAKDILQEFSNKLEVIPCQNESN